MESVLDRSRRYVFSDVDFSLTKLPSTDDIAKKLDLNAVRQAVVNLISTNKGEKPFEPNFGCNLTAFLFEPFTAVTQTVAENEIKFALMAYEPRVVLQSVSVSDDPDRNSLYITIEYTIKSPEAAQDVVSFFVERLR